MKNLSLVVVLVACVARTASAADDPKKMFEAATAEFNLGHYEKAAAMYEDIYKLTLEPVLLYNIAQAHRLGGDFDKAVFFYKGYLRAQPQARNHSEVQKRIAELELAIEAKRRGQERPPNVPATVEPRAHHETATSQPPPATAPPSATPEPGTWRFWTIIGGVVVVGVVVAVAVVATQAPSFGANLPETGPGAHALTAAPPTPSPLAAPAARLVEVRF